MSLPNSQLWGLGLRTHFVLNLRLPGLGVLGTGCMAIALATGVFFQRVWG